MKKSKYSLEQLNLIFNNFIESLPKLNTVHVFCDGSVSEAGRGGCGALVRDYMPDSGYSESEYGLRLSDGISSTHAELQGIKLGLTQTLSIKKDEHMFVDSRSALESLYSNKPEYHILVTACKRLIQSV